MYNIETVFTAKTIEEALVLLRDHKDAVPVAGGTDVLLHIKHGKLDRPTLVTVQGIPELRGVRMEDNGDIVIGPGTTFRELESDPIVTRHLPMLASAAHQVGSPQIRVMATVGGNICNGAVSADSMPSLLAYGAELELRDTEGVENRPLLGFHTGPGRVALKAGQLLTAIRIHRSSYEAHGTCYLKFGQRRAMEISTLGVAVNVKLSEDKRVVEDIRIAYGVAAPIPTRCVKLEAMLQGREPDESFFSDYRAHVLEELSPRDSWRASKELRVQLIREQGARAAEQAIIAAGGSVK